MGLLAIGGFLFYRGRLYRLLQKIYQLKQQKAVKKANQSLISQNKKLIAQLQEAQNNPTMSIDVPDEFSEEMSLKLDGDHHQQLSALGLAYKTVKEMLEQQPDMDEEQTITLNERIAHILNIPLNNEQDAKVKELNLQIDFLKEENGLIEQRNQHIERLEAQIKQLKSIDATAIDKAKAPKQGDFADEIYRMKCEKFDMLENINRMKLDIERLSNASDTEKLLTTLQEQVLEQANYIKQSDVVVSLLEKELEAANLLITELEKQGVDSDAELDASVIKIEEELKSLQTLQKSQRDNLTQLKEKIATPEAGADLEALVKTQQADIKIIEQNIEDTENSITNLKLELRNAQDRIKVLESQLAASESKKSNDNTNNVDDASRTLNKDAITAQADEELEDLLKKLINDSQELLTTIADLEDENDKLKAKLTAK
ncbi:MAG: hypothetical protein MJK11_06735 [Pseudomonadales bacterium]|nr:hypothetical protein [Pseudomonadales bacterium]